MVVGSLRVLLWAVALGLAGCGGGSPDVSASGAPKAQAQRAEPLAAPARRPVPDLRNMRAMHLGGNWGGNVGAFPAPALSDAPSLTVGAVAIESSVSTFRDGAGVSHTNDAAKVKLTNVQVGGVTLAKAGFWVFRDTATGTMGLQFRPALDENLAGITGFSGDVNLAIPSPGVTVDAGNLSQASGTALALVKAVVAHAPEIIAGATGANVGSGSTMGQPATLSAALASLRTALNSVDSDFFAFLKSMNVDWVGISVAIHYDSFSDPTVRVHYCTRNFTDSGGVPTTCTFRDEDLVSFIGRARAAGFRVYLTLAFETASSDLEAAGPACRTPQYKMSRYWLGAPQIPSWSPASTCIAASDWWWNPAHPDHASKVAAFFSSYQQVAMKYAALAESTGVELYSLGTETENLFRSRAGVGAYTNHFQPQLQAMVAGVRSVYGGAVTYDQAFDPLVPSLAGVFGGGEGNQFLFNDVDFDVVGLSAYFPLASAAPGRALSVSELEKAWDTVFQTYLRPLRARYGSKPIVFTEVGYGQDVNAVIQANVNDGKPGVSAAGYEQQANIYQAFYNVNARNSGLVAGTFWWGNDNYLSNGVPCNVVQMGVRCNPQAIQVVASGNQALLRKDIDRLFDWAGATFPALFSGTPSTGASQGLYFRNFAGTGTLLGVQEATGNVYVHNGRQFNMINVGPLSTFLSFATASGF